MRSKWRQDVLNLKIASLFSPHLRYDFSIFTEDTSSSSVNAGMLATTLRMDTGLQRECEIIGHRPVCVV